MRAARRRDTKFAVKRTIVDFFENTSIHGLKYITENNTSACERVFWALAICALMVASIYLSILHLRRFVENPMRSTIITFHGPVDLVPFPAVTICNSNLILHSKMDAFVKSLNLEDDEKLFLLKNIPQILGYFMVIDYNTSDLIKMDSIFHKLGYEDVLTVLRKIGPTCEEMLLQCRWNGKVTDCSMIFEESLTIDGICCSFNYYGSRFDFQPNYTIFTGWRSGLSIIMNILPQKVLHSTVTSVGYKVTVHNSMEYPGFERTYKIVSKGLSYFQVSAEKLTNTEDVQYLTKEQRKCVFSGERPLKYHHTYHFSNCVAETYSKFIFQFCRCVPFYFSFSVRPKCRIRQLECLQRYINERRALDPTDMHCPARCENVIYQVKSSSVDLNDITLALDEKNTKNLQDSSTVVLNVFLTGNPTLLSRDVLTTSTDLLSSIGGIYGLFMGCSIITIVELIYYATLRFLVNLGWLKRPRRVRKKRTSNPESEFRTWRTGGTRDVHGIERVYFRTAPFEQDSTPWLHN